MAETKKKASKKEKDVILSVRHLKQYFKFGTGKFKYIKAVHDISFDVYRGEVFGLVGESGCGKTTTGRSIIRLYQPTSGDIIFNGVRINAGTRWNEKEIKYTRIRLNDELKAIDEEMKKELGELSPNDKDKAEAIKTKAASKKEDAIARANSIISEQREKIKQAKYDASHCDKDYSEEAVRKCKEKYKDLLSRCDQGKNPSLLIDEQDKALFNQYKEDLNDAKHAKITLGMQMIFQDPTASLNPRMTVRDIIAEGLKINGVRNKKRINDEVNKMLELVGLLPEHAQRYPHEFSGGQRQRIGIARALIMKPELIIADEPVSALDVSIQAQIINLLNNIREELGLTIIFIAHNLSVVKYFCDRIAVMYYGKIVELASSDELFAHPFHPYTISLLSAVPHPDPIHERDRERIKYNPETDHDYSIQKTRMVEITKDHYVYCSEDEEKEYKAKLEAGYASQYAK